MLPRFTASRWAPVGIMAPLGHANSQRDCFACAAADSVVWAERLLAATMLQPRAAVTTVVMFIGVSSKRCAQSAGDRLRPRRPKGVAGGVVRGCSERLSPN